MGKFNPTDEQKEILSNDKKNMIVSASAGSGKTTVLVEYITDLVTKKLKPIKRFLVLTFTKVAGQEMKSRLFQSLTNAAQTPFVLEQIDDLPNADICTIDSFCEKVIKKNIDKLMLDQSFSVIDEGQATKVKHNAFEDACSAFLLSNPNEYWHLYNAFKRNKEEVFACLLKIEDKMTSSHNAQDLIQEILTQQEEYFYQSCQILQEYYKNLLRNLQKKLDNIEGEINEKYQRFVDILKNITTNLLTGSFFDMVDKAKTLEIPTTPKVSGQREVANQIIVLRASLKEIIDDLGKFNFQGKAFSLQKSGALAIALIKLYQVYRKNYQDLKENEDWLDFADIEKLCTVLLQDEQVCQNLQASYDYIFIDEYQDTNTLQESLIKKIAKYSTFVAVGDPKQSIYGFRNASMEIMQKDIQQNLSNPDGKVVFLRGNFRSGKQVLDFVNSIFSPLMKQENTGIDYQNTSMLDGKAEYLHDDKKCVDVCFVTPMAEENEEKRAVYSVKNAIMSEKDKDTKEAQAICKYIDDLLVSKIYDLKQKSWRKVQLEDIVILLRGHGTLMDAIERELVGKGYPVLADNKQALIQNAQVQMLISSLRLVLKQNAEVDLVSVLLSKIGGMTVDEIANIAISMPGETLTEKLISSKHNKIQELNKKIEKFSKEYQIFGIERAFELLFDETDYFVYLHTLGEQQVQIIEKFLSVILNSEYNFAPASLVAYLMALQSGRVEKQQAETNAIRIMTIHGSKGMEYPIVILAGCGMPITRINRKPYCISDRLGLSTLEFDEESMLKIRTPQFEASKLLIKNDEYIDELMIFYVALTRAQNRLILTGQYDIEKYGRAEDMFDCKCYFDWLLFGQEDGIVESIKSNDKTVSELANFEKMENVYNLKNVETDNLIYDEDVKLTEKIKKYFNFEYKNVELSKIEFKNSVTGLLKLQIDDKAEEDSEYDVSVAKNGFSASEVGTIYHTALKEIEFNEIDSLQDVKSALQKLVEQGFLSKEEENIININILYKSLIILKKLTKGKKIYKEKPFIMKLPIDEVLPVNASDGILIQGVVDMFALGEENILVDYKFTSMHDSKQIIEKYKNQLILYAKAIENAFDIKLQKKYIFSIKNCDLIEFY